MSTQKLRLPYVDNAQPILITLVINIAVTFIYFWPEGVVFFDVIQDTVICVVITVVINLLMVYLRMKKLRAKGALPSQVPESKLMQRLPQNPVALGFLYTIFFGLVAVGLNALILWFFGMDTMAFIPWMTYKLIYVTVLTIKVVEYCIFRYVQPDWAGAGSAGAAGADTASADAASANTATDGKIVSKPVKDPLPKISVFQAMFGSVTSTIAMNIIIGTFAGGVFIAEGGADVIIAHSTVEGLPITGFVFGFLTGLLTTNAIVKAVNSGILASVSERPEGTGPAGSEEELAESAPAAPALPAPDKRFSWMPKARIPFTILICVAVMAFSMVMLPFIASLFGLSVLNFYQFSIFMVIYSSLLGKPLSYVITQRCSQSDYILYVLKKHGRI